MSGGASMSTPTRPRTLTKQLVVRVPADLHVGLVADAAAHGRTVAQSVRFHLAAAVLAAPVNQGDTP